MVSPWVLGRPLLVGPLLLLDALRLLLPACSLLLPPATALSLSSFPFPEGFSVFGHLVHH